MDPLGGPGGTALTWPSPLGRGRWARFWWEVDRLVPLGLEVHVLNIDWRILFLSSNGQLPIGPRRPHLVVQPLLVLVVVLLAPFGAVVQGRG